MKILLTGFDPFCGAALNPSWEAVKRAKAPDGCELKKLEIPTSFSRSFPVLLRELEAFRPDAVILVGLAAGRGSVTVERLGVNLDDASACDNDGDAPTDRPIAEGGPAAYFSTLPVKLIVEAVRGAGIPADISNTAGTFVCNHLLYCLLRHISENRLNTVGGFIHVPATPELLGPADLSGTPLMTSNDVVKTLETAISATCEFLKNR